MAITRAQQYKQMLQNGGRIGFRVGTGEGKDTSGRDYGGNVGSRDRGMGMSGKTGFSSGPDDRGNRQQNINQRNVVREARVRAVEDFIDRPTFGFTDAAKFNIAPLPIRIIQGLGNMFTGTPTTPPTMDRDDGNAIPLWAQLGFNSEAEYLASLQAQAPSTMEEKTLTPVQQALKERGIARAFVAKGGRAGFRSAGAVSAAYGDAAAKVGPVERPGGGRGDGPSGPPRVINPPPSGSDKPIIPNLKEGFTQHNINNQKLKNAVTLGLISNDEYNILGGYDVNQTMGLNPFMTGMTSGLYNVYQTIKGDQPASEIYGDVKRNVQGSFGLPEDLQAKYDNIMSMSSDELTNQLADLNLANQRTAQMAEGGMPYEGGIMDLDAARQELFLGGVADAIGKGLKKVTRGIKKIVKSPIGKAAMLYFAPALIPGGASTLGGVFQNMGGLGALKTKLFGTPGYFNIGSALHGSGTGKAIASTPGFLGKLGLTKGAGSMALTGKGVGAAITAASLLPLFGLGTGEEDEEQAEELLRGQGIDIAAIRANPNQYLAPRFAAEGGIMRQQYQEGSKEPVAKKTMPLLDMG